MNDDLKENTTDYVVTAAKAALGMVPFAGSLLAELAGTIIPKQRIDRLVDFARKLEEGLGNLDQTLIRSRLTDENFTDLLEESSRQAAQAVTDERRQYLASLLAAGISEDHISFVESKHILRLLSQINDIEIIWLRFYNFRYLSGDDDFRKKNEAVLKPIAATISSDDNTLDREALQKNYTQHLVSLGLLIRPLQIEQKTKLPIFDKYTQDWKVGSPKTTRLGRLLLSQIGLSQE